MAHQDNPQGNTVNVPSKCVDGVLVVYLAPHAYLPRIILGFSTGTSCSLIRLVVVKADVRKEKF